MEYNPKIGYIKVRKELICLGQQAPHGFWTHYGVVEA